MVIAALVALSSHYGKWLLTLSGPLEVNGSKAVKFVLTTSSNAGTKFKKNNCNLVRKLTG